MGYSHLIGKLFIPCGIQGEGYGKSCRIMSIEPDANSPGGFYCKTSIGNFYIDRFTRQADYDPKCYFVPDETTEVKLIMERYEV